MDGVLRGDGAAAGDSDGASTAVGAHARSPSAGLLAPVPAPLAGSPLRLLGASPAAAAAASAPATAEKAAAATAWSAGPPPPSTAAAPRGTLRSVSIVSGGAAVKHMVTVPQPKLAPAVAPPQQPQPQPQPGPPAFRGVRLASRPGGGPSTSSSPPPPRYEAFVTEGGVDVPVGEYATAAAAARGHDHAVVCFCGAAACGAATPGRLNFPGESLVPLPATTASSLSSSVQQYIDPATARGVVLPRVDSLFESLRRARALADAGLAAVAADAGALQLSGLCDPFCARCGMDIGRGGAGGAAATNGLSSSSSSSSEAAPASLACGFCGRSFHMESSGTGGCSDLPPGAHTQLEPGAVYACCFCAARGQVAQLLQPAAPSPASTGASSAVTAAAASAAAAVAPRLPAARAGGSRLPPPASDATPGGAGSDNRHAQLSAGLLASASLWTQPGDQVSSAMKQGRETKRVGGGGGTRG
jgi:hypothetical protein